MLRTILGVLMMTAYSVGGHAAEPVPLVRVLAVPDGYLGKVITVSGVLGQDNEGRFCVYLDKGSFDAKVAVNAVPLMFGEKMSTDKAQTELQTAIGSYVIASGNFDPTPPKPRLYVGVLRDVSFVRTYPLLKELPQTKP